MPRIKKIEDIEFNDMKETTPDEEVSFKDIPKTKKSFLKKNYLKLIVLFLLLVLIGGYFGYRYWTSPKAIAARIEKQNMKMISDISKFMRLPQGDKPIFYEITDPVSISKTQPFFSGSEKGDRLIIFPTSSKALIYNPTKKMIINVGPIQFDQSQQTSSNVGTKVETTQSPEKSTTTKKN
jgi:hypothetical protein